jgi:hypothetical protein
MAVKGIYSKDETSISPATESAMRDQHDSQGLCIRCAVGSAEFKERAPYLSNPLEDGLEARAWINGRRFRLLVYRMMKPVCTSCGETVSAVYSPEDQQAA